MEHHQHSSKTDLARNTHHVILEAQKGYTVLVENHGQAEVAFIDIVDFQLQRAALHFLGFPKEYQRDLEITKPKLASLATDQERFNLVIGHYLAEHQSLGRSAA